VDTVEYLGRLWSCTVRPKYAHPVTGRLRFALTPMEVIDLLADYRFIYRSWVLTYDSCGY
jgi:hypothetical protein